MQRTKEYGQNAGTVNVPLHGPSRQRGQQTHRANVRVGQERIRVCGNFDTLMGWVRRALEENTARGAA